MNEGGMAPVEPYLKMLKDATKQQMSTPNTLKHLYQISVVEPHF